MAKANATKPAAAPRARAPREKAAPLDEQWVRRVRRILDHRESERFRAGRPTVPADRDWTLSSLLALPIPFEQTVRICGTQLGSDDRVRAAHAFWASLPGIPAADDTLRRSLKSEARRGYALSGIRTAGRSDFDGEVAAMMSKELIGTTLGDSVVGAAASLGTAVGLDACVALSAHVKKLESAKHWLCSWTLLRSFTSFENPRAAEPYLRRYCPAVARDAKPRRFEPQDHTREAAVSLARIGDADALAWLADHAEREEHAYPLTVALGWAYERERDRDFISRYRAHAAGEKTQPFVAPFLRNDTVPTDGTIAELDAVIATTPEDRMARHRRGNLLFDAGHLQRALHDYDACMNLNDMVNDEVPLRRWLARAALHLKSYADVELRRWLWAYGERLDEQRRKLARHVAGLAGIDEATEGASTAEDRIEAWFFAGARALLIGETETGRRALERCLSAVTKTPSSEQISARAMLESSR